MKQIFTTTNAPAPLGPYNQAVASNGTLYVSGQIAIDPATGEFVTDNIAEETHRVMKNIHAILLEAGATFEHVLKASIFIANMDNFAAINQVYASYFNEDTAPARECVEVSKLPKSVNVEISVIAYI